MTLVKYLVLWWMEQKPYAALMHSRFAAEASASVRNGVMLVLEADRVKGAVDYYRRDDEGHPMPFEWRDLHGQVKS